MKKITTILLTFLFLALLTGCVIGDMPEDTPPTMEQTAWPDWVPSTIPVYRYGELIKAEEFADGGVLTFVNNQMDKNPMECYKRELDNKGWVISYEFEKEEGEFGVGMVQDENNLIYSFIPDEEEGFVVTIVWEL
ncbi:MAG: hypothetical protein ACQEP5_03905 [Actinomycetota bacterium]